LKTVTVDVSKTEDEMSKPRTTVSDLTWVQYTLAIQDRMWLTHGQVASCYEISSVTA